MVPLDTGMHYSDGIYSKENQYTEDTYMVTRVVRHGDGVVMYSRDHHIKEPLELDKMGLLTGVRCCT